MAEPDPRELEGGARPAADPPWEEAAEEGGDAIIGATLQALKRAAHEVEIERRVAETLQRSLLPELPRVPGLELAAHYRPGSAESRVGGDWYDAILLRGGMVGIAIGDVVGRGVHAAARMAHLQSALRAYALESLRPGVVLERMNGFVLEGERGGMVTLLFGLVDPDAGTVTVASAGHPPPLVVEPGGEAGFAETPAGSPLGVTRFPTYEESVTALEPWSSVLLYTDGLVEGRELPLERGLTELRMALRDFDGDPETLCRQVLGAADGRADFRDDLALLALQLRPPAELLELTLATRPSSLAPMRRAVAHWLRLAGAREAEAYEILVACGEACANAVAHAQSATADAPFEVRARRRDAEVEVTVSDSGRWRQPPEDQPGRGLALIRELMEEVEIDADDRGTTVRMRRRLGGPAG